MRAFLIAAITCLTALVFYVSYQMIPQNLEGLATEQIEDVQVNFGEQLADAQSSAAREIAALEEEVSALSQSHQALSSERDALVSEMSQVITQRDRAGVELSAQTELADTAALRVRDLEGQLADRQAALVEAQTALTALNEDLVANRTTSETVSDEMEALRQTAVADAERISQLEAELSQASLVSEGAEQQIANLQSQIAELSATEVARAEDAGARDSVVSSLEAQLAEARLEVEERNAEILTLNTAVEQSDAAALARAAAQIEEAELAFAARDTAATSEIDALTALVAERDDRIVELEAGQADSAGIEAQAALVATQAGQIADLEVEIARLTEVVAAQSDAVASPEQGSDETDVVAQDLAEDCVGRAAALLAQSQISFGVGTSNIDANSVTVLEQLGDLAIGCQNDDLIIEIGGHTDSQGGEANNRALSEARAEAVRDYLMSYGVSSESMVAVGHGETQPIAPNDTAAGRTLNRRITFEWQPRQVVIEAGTEPVSETTETEGGSLLFSGALDR